MKGVTDRKRYIDSQVKKKVTGKKPYKQTAAQKARAAALKLFGQVDKIK